MCMKKIYTIACSALVMAFSLNANAQSFTMPKDTLEFVPYAYTEVSNNVTNTTSDTITISWKIYSHNLPQNWIDNSNFGLCDNQLCYTAGILAGSTQKTLPIQANASDVFKLQIDGSGFPATTVPLYIAVELTHNTTIDTTVFLINRFTTNVKGVSNTSADVSVYPNPAQSDLNVTFDRKMGVEKVAIYNLIGKKVKSYRVTGESAKLNISDTPSGIYFVRFMNNSGQVLATRRFTHQ